MAARKHRLVVGLRELRESAGMTIAEAAQLAGMTPATWGAHERGTRQPDVWQLEAEYAALPGGLCLVAVPKGQVDEGRARTPAEIAAQLHALADEIASGARRRRTRARSK